MAEIEDAVFEPKKQNDYSKPRVSPVVTGKVGIRKRKPVGRQLKEIFFAEDWEDIKPYIVETVVLPTIRYTFFSVLQVLILGRGASTGGYHDYTTHARKNGTVTKNSSADFTNRNKRKPDYRDYIFEPDFEKYPNQMEARMHAKEDAEKVLRELKDCVEQFECATKADFYAAIGMSTEYVEGDWGWRNLDMVQVYECPQGFYINLPKAVYLK